jgi:hypothetical protein
MASGNMKIIPSFNIILLLLTVLLIACSDEEAVLPVLDTIQVEDTDITSSTAILQGRIKRIGNRKIIEYGIELSKNYYFNPSETKGFTTPPDTGLFQVEFINLDPSTKYYYKAYALINTANVYSANNLYFTTKAP